MLTALRRIGRKRRYKGRKTKTYGEVERKKQRWTGKEGKEEHIQIILKVEEKLMKYKQIERNNLKKGKIQGNKINKTEANRREEDRKSGRKNQRKN